MKSIRIAMAVVAMALPATAVAGMYGFATSLSSTQNMDGATVPEVIVTIDAGRKSLQRSHLQGAVQRELARAGVKPHIVELQSVATAAIQLAEAQDMGMQTNCYETWCARVSVEGSGF